MANGLVQVKFAQLAAPLRVDRIKSGTTVSNYLAKKEINFSSSVKVNGESVKADYRLKNGDLITTAVNVEGGR